MLVYNELLSLATCTEGLKLTSEGNKICGVHKAEMIEVQLRTTAYSTLYARVHISLSALVNSDAKLKPHGCM